MRATKTYDESSLILEHWSGSAHGVKATEIVFRAFLDFLVWQGLAQEDGRRLLKKPGGT